MIRVALVVGHEADKPGAFGVAPLSCYEYEYNKSLSAMIACNLMDEGIQSEIFFRDNIGIHGAYAHVNAFYPEAVVELHFNAAGVGNIRGTETLFSQKIRGSASLAAALQASMCLALERLGSGNRGIKVVGEHDRGYVNLTAANCPSALIEPFFGDSSEDAALGLNKKKDLALSISRGIAAFVRSQNGLN